MRYTTTAEYQAYKDREKAYLDQYAAADLAVVQLIAGVDWENISIPAFLELIDENRVLIARWTGLARLKKNGRFTIEDFEHTMQIIENDTSKSTVCLRRVSSKQNAIFEIISGPLLRIWPNRFLKDACKLVYIGPISDDPALRYSTDVRVPAVMFFARCKCIIDSAIPDTFAERVTMANLERPGKFTLKEDFSEKIVITY